MKALVVGAGVIGSTAAWSLARQGVEVTLVDAQLEGRATAAGAGILPPDLHFATSPRLRALVRGARAFYPQLVERLREHGGNSDFYATPGTLQVALDEREAADLPRLEAELVALRSEGFSHIGKVACLRAEEARRLHPLLGDTTHGALLAEGAARVDGRRLCEALLGASERLGVRRVAAEARFEVRHGRVERVLTAQGDLSADSYLLAAGCWSGELSRQLGLSLPVHPQRGQILQLFDHRGSRGAFDPRVGLPSLLSFRFHYAVAFPGGRIAAGATREDDVGFAAHVTASGVASLLQRTLQLAPGLADAAFGETRVGLRPVTPDGLPVVGALPGLSNAFVSAGHGSYGLELGPYCGWLLAEQMLGRALPLDVSPFSASRFDAASMALPGEASQTTAPLH